MNKFGVLAVAAGAAVIASGAASALAGSVTVPFPSDASVYFSATNGSGTIGSNGGQSGYMWTTGDNVVDFFAVTGLSSATSISATFDIVNVLGDGNNQFADVLVNGIDVGTFEALDSGYSGDTQTLTFSASFAPISGPDFGLEFVLDNTIPFGGGSIAFVGDGSATLSAVPEPATWALMLVGFTGVGFASYRASRKSTAFAA